MLKIIDSKDIVTDVEARDLYPGCEIIMLDFNFDKLSGRVYAISTASESSEELINLLRTFDDDKLPALIGYYNEGDRIGVLDEIE